MFRTAYCAFALVALAASLGLFDACYNRTWYVYFTMLSNYYCMGVMVAELVQTVRGAQKDACPHLKFAGVVMILMTCVVYNFILARAPGHSAAANYDVGSLLMHLLLPLMFIADWFLFYQRGKSKWYDPLIALALVLIYGEFIFIRAKFARTARYPYFFINPDKIGREGVLKWICLIVPAFTASAYLLMLIDHLPCLQKLHKHDIM